MPAGSAPAPVAVFDCDGVILQSNRLKSDAFGAVLEEHDPALVAEFVAWHRATGGVSRFEKFARFFRDMLVVPDWQARTDAACAAFGARVSQQLRVCPTVPGLEDALGTLTASGTRCSVNTGGAQDEVREVLTERGLARFFETILGSPATKRDNMIALHRMGLVQAGGVYLGDSRLDWELAQEFGLAFIYVAYESEWPEGAQQTLASGGVVVNDLTALA